MGKSRHQYEAERYEKEAKRARNNGDDKRAKDFAEHAKHYRWMDKNRPGRWS